MADLEDLDRLAPDVDTDAALEQFRRRRSESTRRRWPIVASAAAAVAVLALIGVAMWAPDGDAPLATGPTDQSAGPADPAGDSVSFQVLGVHEAVTEIGTLAAVTEEDQALEFWDQTGAPAPYPEIKFETTVLVSITIPDDACPPELADFEREGHVLTPVFVEPPGGCEEPLIPKTYVVAFPRDIADEAFTVRLPADDTYGFEEQTLRVSVLRQVIHTFPAEEVPSEPPPCADIERFADQLVAIGIDYDRAASQSPDALFDSSEVAFTGRLTGGFTSEPASEGDLDLVGYEVEIDSLHKSPARANITNPFTVFVSVGVDPAPFADAITPGIPVVVFAKWFDRAEGSRPIADLDGFVTACPGGPLLGFVSNQGEWSEVATLDDLSDRLDPG